jgi:MFS family permease
VIATAAAFLACSYVAFALIRVQPDSPSIDEGSRPGWWTTLPAATSTLSRDSRFLRYLLGCFVFGVSGLSYEPIVRSYFSNDLHLNYVQCVVLADVLPSVVSVLTIQRMGAWLDRTNPLVAWAVIRVGWGLDAILLALAPGWPVGTLAIGSLARVSRGSVMNGSWVLWWQLGTNYFATRRETTSIYMGCLLTMTGVQRLCGPQLGAFMAGRLSRRGVLLIGGLMVLVSAFLAWRQAEAERVDGHYLTFSDKEHRESALSKES